MLFRSSAEDVTDLKLAAQALQESEERFRRLSDGSFEGIAISDAGKMIVANTRLAEMLRCEMQELVGTKVSDWVAPESLELVMEHMRTGSEEPYEHLLRRRDGSTLPVETRARQLPWKGRNVRVTAIRDISDRKRAEEALQAEKAFSEAVIDSLPGAFYVIDTRGRLVR